MLLSEGLEFASHGQVVAQFGRLFAKTKRLDPVFHGLLSHAFQLRQSADYDSGAAINPVLVKEVLEEGFRFLAEATAYLKPRQPREG